MSLPAVTSDDVESVSCFLVSTAAAANLHHLLPSQSLELQFRCSLQKLTQSPGCVSIPLFGGGRGSASSEAPPTTWNKLEVIYTTSVLWVSIGLMHTSSAAASRILNIMTLIQSTSGSSAYYECHHRQRHTLRCSYLFSLTETRRFVWWGEDSHLCYLDQCFPTLYPWKSPPCV